MEDKNIGYFQGTPVYSKYKVKEESMTKFNDKVFHLLLLMNANEDIYKIQFMFDGDEVFIRYKENRYEIDKVTYITIF